MPRTPKLWYWKARKGWYVYIHGDKVPLGKDRDEALRKFHEIMAKEPGEPHPPSGDSLAAVLDDFLSWTLENRAQRTYERYQDFCQSFCQQHGRTRVSQINPGHVTAWLSSQEGWGPTTKRNAITTLQRGFNWAVKNRGLDRNPIRGMEKPEPNSRTTVVSPEEFDQLLEHVHDRPFRDLLVVCYDSGCRPQEIKGLEARQVDLAKRRAVITADDGAKGGITRAIYFPTERSMEIIRRLSTERPTGPLFLNNKGNPWTGFAVKCRFERLDTKLGKRYRHYDLRHSFVARKLLAGVDSHVVAALAGHKDTKMIDTVYSHVADDHQFMLREAMKGEDAQV